MVRLALFANLQENKVESRKAMEYEICDSIVKL